MKGVEGEFSMRKLHASLARFTSLSIRIHIFLSDQHFAVELSKRAATMTDYDSNSSGAEDIETNVLLGYASREPTGDDVSQLGGHPVRSACHAIEDVG